MEIVLFITSLIALFALIVFFIHKTILDERYYESDCQRDDEILDRLSEISFSMKCIADSLKIDSESLDSDDSVYIDCDYEDEQTDEE